MDLDELAQQMHLRPDSMTHLAAHAEFIRRQTEAQLEAAHATIIAARAEEMAAKASIATADAKNECTVFARLSYYHRSLRLCLDGRSFILILERREITSRRRPERIGNRR